MDDDSAGALASIAWALAKAQGIYGLSEPSKMGDSGAYLKRCRYVSRETESVNGCALSGTDS